MPLAIIENLDLEKPSFGPSKWPRKLKPAKNSKLPKWPENCFEPFGKGGWPPISTWISSVVIDYGIDWIVKGRSGCDRGCRKSEFSWREKTLEFLRRHTQASVSQTTYIHGLHYW
jgi:hypothetical protein